VSCAITVAPAGASARPIAPPVDDTTAASITIRRISRLRLAPSAARTASSLRRPTARGSAGWRGSRRSAAPPRRRHQHEQFEPRVAERVLLGRHHDGADAGVGRGEFLLQRRRDAAHVVGGGLEADAGRESRDDVQVMGVVVGEVGRREVDRGPVVDVAIAEDESGRHHPDHLVAVVVHQQRASENAGVAAVSPLPQPVADDHDRRARAILVVGERTADRRMHAEDDEEILADAAAEQLFGRPIRRDVGRAAARGGDAGERVLPPLPFDVVARRRRVTCETRAGVVLSRPARPGSGRHRKRPDQDRVDGREDRRVRAILARASRSDQ
jgi:hypothetical protein